MESMNDIRKHLEKFYRGETSLEEEKKLTEYFSSNKVPEELIPDKELFLAFESDEKQVHAPDSLNTRLITAIERADKKQARTRRISLYSLSGLAAGLLILIAVYLSWFKDDRPSMLASNHLTETYEDPMEAYEQAKETLIYVSEKLNRGTNELKHVQEAARSVDPLKSLSKINKGSKELSLLGQLHHARKLDEIQ